jgi:hypothetical protein
VPVLLSSARYRVKASDCPCAASPPSSVDDDQYCQTDLGCQTLKPSHSASNACASPPAPDGLIYPACTHRSHPENAGPPRVQTTTLPPSGRFCLKQIEYTIFFHHHPFSVSLPFGLAAGSTILTTCDSKAYKGSPLDWTRTALSFHHRSLWWFEASSCKAASRDQQTLITCAARTACCLRSNQRSWRTVVHKSISKAFGFELMYLLDNHIVLCLMLLLPRLIHTYSSEGANPDNRTLDESDTSNAPNVFINSFEPPLQGELCSVEAQEHYVQVTSTEESRMVLYRFSDVVRQLPDTLGMQSPSLTLGSSLGCESYRAARPDSKACAL